MMRVTRLAAALALGGLAVASAGCAASLEVRDARAGRVTGLSQRVTAGVERGVIGRGDAVDLARAVVRGEVERATGDPGLRRVGMLAACARGARSALARRADRPDDVGAAAAMLLVDARVDGPGAFDGDLAAPEPRWRAIAARGLNDDAHGRERRARLVDGDQEVRLAALRAAAEASDLADLPIVLEAARVDPYPPARAAAARAAGEIGGERAVLALKDLWAQADDGLRRSIAQAWAAPGSIEEGGRRELAWAAEHERGGAAIVAAYELVRAGGDGAAEALFVLERGILTGPAEDRIFAQLLSPWSEPVRAAVRKASDDPDDAIAIASLARRLRDATDAADRAAAATRLMKFASGTSRWSRHAKIALAAANVRAVHPLLLRDLRSTDRQLREAAGIALTDFGDLPHAAIVAVDPDVDVRTRVACAILAH